MCIVLDHTMIFFCQWEKSSVIGGDFAKTLTDNADDTWGMKSDGFMCLTVKLIIRVTKRIFQSGQKQYSYGYIATDHMSIYSSTQVLHPTNGPIICNDLGDISILRPDQNGRNFVYDISDSMFLNANCCIVIPVSLICFSKGSIDSQY